MTSAAVHEHITGWGLTLCLRLSTTWLECAALSLRVPLAVSVEASSLKLMVGLVTHSMVKSSPELRSTHQPSVATSVVPASGTMQFRRAASSLWHAAA